jgi:hypothetical protein
VAKHVDAAELEVFAADILAAAADAVLVARHICLPHWPACMYSNSHDKAAWRRGAHGRKRAGWSGKRNKLRVVVWHRKQEFSSGARARVSR